MTEEPTKKPRGIGWYATWGVLAVVLYVASFGPACWITARAGRGDHLLSIAYQPVFRVWMESDMWLQTDSLHDFLRWYAMLGAGRESHGIGGNGRGGYEFKWGG